MVKDDLQLPCFLHTNFLEDYAVTSNFLSRNCSEAMFPERLSVFLKLIIIHSSDEDYYLSAASQAAEIIY